MAQLGLERGKELLKGGKILRAAKRQAQLSVGDGVIAVVEGDLQDLGDIEIAGEDVGLIAKGAGLNAAARSPLAASAMVFPAFISS